MRIGIVGLGYVGLPLALAFARKFPGTVGFDISEKRITELQQGQDVSEETESQEIQSSDIVFTSNPYDLSECDFFIVGVPTPVDENNNPDLSMVISASKTVGQVMKRGSIVVFESTVYPGVTEDICGPVLEEASGLTCGSDFYLAYSPERINPGDREHTLERIVKVVSGQNEAVLDTVARTYETVILAGVHRAPSIRVAEAAKVIENTQRDLNIALMNELALIFDRMQISTRDVLAAAGSKWNFLKFYPGLVGGHCIGVDPYYLTTAAEQHGYHPQVILSGRRINDNMGKFVAQRTVKLLARKGCAIRDAQVGVFGLTFKENVKDLRNSRVPDIINELREFGCHVRVCDPWANAEEARREYAESLTGLEQMSDLDAAIFAVAHDEFLADGGEQIKNSLKNDGVFIDVKSRFDPADFEGRGLEYWAL